MNRKINTVGIIGLGWLGLPLGLKLKEKYKVIGTTTNLGNLEKYIGDFDQIIEYTALHKQTDVLHLFKDCALIIITLPANNQNYLNQIKEIIAHTPKNAKFIFTSSIGVYENQTDCITEDHHVLKKSILVETENYLLHTLGENLTILRLAGLVGNGRNPVFTLQGRNMEFGLSVVNLIHLEDVIRAVEWIIDGEFFGKIYNIVSPDQPIKKDYYAKMVLENNLKPISFDLTVMQRQILGIKFAKETEFEYITSIYKL